MKSLFGLLVILGLHSSSAQANPDIKEEIVELSRAVRASTLTSKASSQSLQEAREHLRKALNLLDGEDDGSSGVEGCFKFAYEKYYVSQSSSVATDKAVAACKKIDDLDVAKFLYEKHYVSATASAAMDLAAEGSIRSRGKLEIVSFAYEKFYVSLSASAAAKKAGEESRRVPRNGLACVKELYEKYYQSMTAAAAMSKSLQGCSR